MIEVLYIALMIGGLIFVHELGHYLVARWMGVHVVEFSIGFGPKIASFKAKSRHPHLPPTEWVISALPVGGYVKMLGADPTEDVPAEVRDVALNFKPVWRRFLIAVAGPAFNLVLPLFLFFFVGLSIGTALPSVVGTVDQGGPAWDAGIRPGDRIVEVAGEPVSYFSEDMARAIEAHPGAEIAIAWERLGGVQRGRITPRAEEREIIPGVLSEEQGKIGVGLAFSLPIIGVEAGSVAEAAGLRPWDRVVTVDGEAEPYLERVFARLEAAADRPVELGVVSWDERPEGNLGLALGTARTVTLPAAEGDPRRGLFNGDCLVHRVVPGSPGSKELARGDRILAVDGAACTSWLFASYAIANKKKEPFTLTVARGGEVRDVTLAQVEVPWPVDLRPENTALIHGIETVYAVGNPEPIPIDDRLGYAAGFMVRRTAGALVGTVAVIAGLFTGKVSVKEGLGGPVLIAQLTTRAAEAGWATFFNMMALLSISLGLINLLPIPVLDGGTIMFLAIEGIRRKPVSMRARMIATYVGLAFIVVLMVIVLRNDLNRCMPGMIGL